MISKTRLRKILSSFKKVNIAVVGDMMLDEYLIGKVSRISPEAPVPIVNITENNFLLGGAANVIKNIKSLGAQAEAYGIIGNDENGRKFSLELTSSGINPAGIIAEPSRPTIVKSRILAQGQQLIRLDWEKDCAISEKTEEKLLTRFKKNIKKTDAVIMSDYNKGILTPRLAKEIISCCKDRQILVTVDPKPHNFKNYIGANAMTPNRKEALEYLGFKRFETEEQLIESLSRARTELQLEALLLTRSEEGISLFEADRHERIGTRAREVYDVTGAGDSFIAAMTLARTVGATWQEAAITGNIVAGIVVGKVGAAVTNMSEIMEFYKK